MSFRRICNPGLAGGSLLASSLIWFLALAVLVHVSARLLLGDSVPLPLTGVVLARLCVAYAIGGLVAGSTFDRLFPRATRKEEAIAMAFVSAVPFLTGIRIAVEGVGNWTTGDVLRVVGLSLIAGLIAGGSAWRVRACSGSEGRSR